MARLGSSVRASWAVVVVAVVLLAVHCMLVESSAFDSTEDVATQSADPAVSNGDAPASAASTFGTHRTAENVIGGASNGNGEPGANPPGDPDGSPAGDPDGSSSGHPDGSSPGDPDGSPAGASDASSSTAAGAAGWLSVFDALALTTLAVAAGYYWLVRRKHSNAAATVGSSYSYSMAPPPNIAAGGTASSSQASFVDKMISSGKNVLVVYGSQTGTAEEFANRLARECRRHGLRALVVDPEEHSMADNLARLAKLATHLVVFVMATYGEGDPTDNAQEFCEWLQEENSEHLTGLNYTVFGLGNKTYEHFNSAAKLVDRRLTELGASRLFQLGLGDDDANIEEDFLTWKEQMFAHIKQQLSVDECCEEEKRQYQLQLFTEQQQQQLQLPGAAIFTGEIARLHTFERQKAPFDARNPYLAPLLLRKQLQSGGQRQFMHLELDIDGSRLRYEAGDHVAVYPVNDESLVERIGSLLGTHLDTVISLAAVDPDVSKKHPFPCPTTYRTALRHYLDLTAPPKHYLLKELADHTADSQERQQLQLVASNSDEGRAAYASWIHTSCRQLLHVLEDLPSCRPPLDLLCELLPRLQPRYYSISSSARVYPTRIHITCVLVHYDTPTGRVNTGVTTGWLHQHDTLQQCCHTAPQLPHDNGQQQQQQQQGPQQEQLSSSGDGAGTVCRVPRHLTVPCFVRKSQFRLPARPSKPVILIGPGTGLAPMRGFIQERAYQRQNGKEVGETWLFYGCRHAAEDYIYRDELEQYEKDGVIKLVLAFSRDQSPSLLAPSSQQQQPPPPHSKVYVTHRLLQHASDVWRMMHQLAGHVYVCGDAKRMARDVAATWCDIACSEGGLSRADAEQLLRTWRARRRYSEDVWS